MLTSEKKKETKVLGEDLNFKPKKKGKNKNFLALGGKKIWGFIHGGLLNKRKRGREKKKPRKK